MVSEKGTYEHDELIRRYGGRRRRNLIIIVVAACLLAFAAAYGYWLWREHDIRVRSVSRLPSTQYELFGKVTLSEDDLSLVGPELVLPVGMIGLHCKDRKFSFSGGLVFEGNIGTLHCDGDHPARLYMLDGNYYLLMQNNFNKMLYSWRALNPRNSFVEIAHEDLPPELHNATLDKRFAAECYDEWIREFFATEKPLSP